MSHLDFSRHYRLNHPRASANANDLDIQTLLFKRFGALGDEWGGLRSAELQMNEAKLFELLLGARACGEAQCGANKKHCEWLSGFHFPVLQAFVSGTWHDQLDFLHHKDPNAAKSQPKKQSQFSPRRHEGHEVKKFKNINLRNLRDLRVLRGECSSTLNPVDSHVP
ncbi:MAG: hypothetical protein Q8S00_06595 [Deltaproteobacteria bacterium]|nr:hypothetical protein [Deltaproteobacteria bacterium]MDZ4343067.1 hypothetical protein [Candidatus Binatia bacterium]